MRHSKSLSAFVATLVLGATAWAQNPRIVYPQANQDVRGEVTMRFEGIPTGGYAIIKVDGQFKQATSQEFVVLDTISDRATFPRGDGAYKIEIEILNSAGGRVGRDEVSFNVANGKVATDAEAVRLVHWTNQDRIDANVLRFRVFAESNAIIEGGEMAGAAGGGGMGGSSGGGGAADAGPTYLPAPLDYQVTALMRRIVRDVGLYNGSANISTAVAESFERGREGGGNAAGATAAPARPARRKKGASTSSAPVKGPWLPVWTRAGETGKYFIKTIEQNGTEINATRKAPTIAIADLLPTFVDAPVRPGSTWYTTMVILGDLTSRKGVNVRAPITFTAYENIVTPGGEGRRCAKLEARFRLPDEIAKRIAANLGSKVGTTGAAGAAGPTSIMGGGDAGAGADALLPEDIEVARTDVARVLWFDMDRRQILRSEDQIRSYFELPPPLADAGGGGAAMGAGAGADAAAPAEPQKVTYSLNVTTWLDDRIPPPSNVYNGGLGTAHSRDSVTEPGISRVLQPPAR